MNPIATPKNSAEAADLLLQRLLSRSATDTDFRQRLLTDARAALAEHAGVKVDEVPAGLSEFRFVESRDGTEDAKTVVLPALAGAAELSEAELEAVSGGATTTMACVGLALVLIDLAVTCYEHMK